MKFAVVLFSVFLSLNAFSKSVSSDKEHGSFASSLEFTFSTVSAGQNKEAMVILNDSQAFIQSGKLSAFLAQEIKNAQSQDSDLSEEDALDLLISKSKLILKKK